MRFLLLFCLALVFITDHVWSQNTRVQGGLFPEMGLNIPLSQRWKYTAKIESQHGLYRNTVPEDERINYYHYRTDFQSFLEVKLTARIKAAAGYQYRIEDGGNNHRSIQQITWLNTFRTFRVGSRLRADQRFSPDISPEFRLRYRASSDIPLEGEKLDDGEKYVLLSLEFIPAIQGGEFTLENRLVAGIGHYFDRSKKLEFTLDYRTDPYFPNVNRHRIWCKFSFYWSLKGFK
ncbi:MAG: DUF2490 domain-containing protein [Brumimicrobium sp.]|nr:DUF2490 domain-containing protein [Brumimicrobium sp.]